jgi:chromate transport protein ChrA
VLACSSFSLPHAVHVVAMVLVAATGWRQRQDEQRTHRRAVMAAHLAITVLLLIAPWHPPLFTGQGWWHGALVACLVLVDLPAHLIGRRRRPAALNLWRARTA